MRLIAIITLLSLLAYPTYAEEGGTDLPSLAAGVIDTTQTETLGLHRQANVETITIFSPTDSTHHYANGVVMTAFKDVLYCMWQSSPTDEDSPETCVMYSKSRDEGHTWEAPKVLAHANDTAYCTSGGWIAHNDTLTAFINVWPLGLKTIGGYTYFMESNDGILWSELKPVTMYDGSMMKGVIEQDPYTLPSGRVVGAAHFQPGLHVAPIYTDDPTGCSGWHIGEMTTHDRGKQTRELEPSIYRRPDGTLVMLFRDQASSYRKMASWSRDNGASWTEPELTNIPDARVKQSAGNLTDGTPFMVGCFTGNKRRFPLVLLQSSGGICFNKAALLRSGGDDLPQQRYEGKAKTLGYSYPKSIDSHRRLYITYSTNKEIVEVTIFNY